MSKGVSRLRNLKQCCRTAFSTERVIVLFEKPQLTESSMIASIDADE